MITEGSDPTGIQPILHSHQTLLLRATLAVYRAESNVEKALDELARVPIRYLAGARMAWLVAESQLDAAKAKRRSVIARIARTDAERDGRRWLRLVRDAA